MKYLLIVEFLCEIYRREPRARIFLNDQLLDEFYIEQNNTPEASSSSILSSDFNNYRREIKNLKEFGMKKPKIFTLDLPKSFDHLKIKIDIKNDDNNYTNGFITRYTQIILKNLYLIPLNEKLYERLLKIRKNKQFSEKYAWWQSRYVEIFELIQYTYWQDNKEEIDTVENRKFGVSGSFICELRKKYGFFIPKNLYPSYIFSLHPSNLIQYFFNKYKQDEN